jgi:hypothetical protein
VIEVRVLPSADTDVLQLHKLIDERFWESHIFSGGYQRNFDVKSAGCIETDADRSWQRWTDCPSGVVHNREPRARSDSLIPVSKNHLTSRMNPTIRCTVFSGA